MKNDVAAGRVISANYYTTQRRVTRRKSSELTTININIQDELICNE